MFETIATRDGEIVGCGKYELSPGGEHLTITGEQQSVVFDRVPAD